MLQWQEAVLYEMMDCCLESVIRTKEEIEKPKYVKKLGRKGFHS